MPARLQQASLGERLADVAAGTVSKFLLEHATRIPILSFRPGYLSDPFGLPEALEGARYRYSSSTTANNSLTHLPFRLSYNRSSQGESSIFEFPVTVEDEAQPPMNERLDAALLLAKRIAVYGGIYVLLTHPNVTAEKLEFERQLVSQLSGTAWFGSLDQFGAWWAARDSIRVQVTDSADLRTIGLNVPLPPGRPLTESPCRLDVDHADGRQRRSDRPGGRHPACPRRASVQLQKELKALKRVAASFASPPFEELIRPKN